MNFLNNGILIQDTNREPMEFLEKVNFTEPQFQSFRDYQGLGRYYSWPLQIENDDLSKQLTTETERWFVKQYPDDMVSYNSEIIPDRKFCIEYIKHCRVKDIKIRVLFCQTDMEEPVWDTPMPKLNFLGYDYSTPESFYSSIPEDLLEPVRTYMDYPIYQALVRCKDLLNNNKLFETEEDIRTYIERRNKVAESDIQWSTRLMNDQEFPVHLVETDCDFIIFRLSEVMGEL